MPPHVVRAVPVVRARRRPAQCFRRLAAHLVDVQHSVLRAQIAWFQLERAQRRIGRFGIMAAFLQRERVHRDNRMVLGPQCQHASRACAHRIGVAGEIIHELGRPQREEVIRICCQDLVVDPAREPKIGIERGRKGPHMRILDKARQGREGPAGRLEVAYFAAEHEDGRLEQARGHRFGNRGRGGARKSARIAALQPQALERLSVRGHERIGWSAAPMRFICASVTMLPRIAWKRSSFTPETMYCQR